MTVGSSRARRRVALALAASILYPCSGGIAGETSTVRRDVEFPSPSLGRPVTADVYVPAGYAQDAAPYPVLYLLHGYGASGDAWLDAAGLRETANRLIAEDKIAPLIIVMPDAGNSWYVDSERHGPIETALVHLPVAVQTQLNAAERASGRAVAGFSMGGFGALRLAMRHPQDYAFAGSIAGALVTGHDPFQRLGADFFGTIFGDPFDPASLAAASPVASIDRLARRDRQPTIFLWSGDDDEFGFAERTATFHARLRAAEIASELRIDDGNHSWDYVGRVLPDLLVELDAAWKPSDD